MGDRVIKLQAKLPDGDANGLTDPAVVNRLMADPTKMRVGIVIFNIAKIETDTESGDEVAKTLVHRFEPIVDDSRGDASALERLLMRGYERRTGTTTLDDVLEGDVREAFDALRTDDDD
jgi:hypothetical protein